MRAWFALLWLPTADGTDDTWSRAYDSYLLASSSHARSAPAAPSSEPQKTIMSQCRRRYVKMRIPAASSGFSPGLADRLDAAAFGAGSGPRCDGHLGRSKRGSGHCVYPELPFG